MSLCLGYVEKEKCLLPKELVKLSETSIKYTFEQAEAQAKGVSENRLQNIVITLDKLKLALRQPCQPESPPLAIVPDKEVIDYLWNGMILYWLEKWGIYRKFKVILLYILHQVAIMIF